MTSFKKETPQNSQFIWLIPFDHFDTDLVFSPQFSVVSSFVSIRMGVSRHFKRHKPYECNVTEKMTIVLLPVLQIHLRRPFFRRNCGIGRTKMLFSFTNQCHHNVCFVRQFLCQNSLRQARETAQVVFIAMKKEKAPIARRGRRGEIADTKWAQTQFNDFVYRFSSIVSVWFGNDNELFVPNEVKETKVKII